MKSARLSKSARELLRRRALGEHVEVTKENLKAYQELVEAGVMYPLSGFMVGPEAAFRFTKDGWENREELQRPRFAPSAMLRRICRALSPMGKSVSGTS